MFSFNKHSLEDPVEIALWVNKETKQKAPIYADQDYDPLKHEGGGEIHKKGIKRYTRSQAFNKFKIDNLEDEEIQIVPHIVPGQRLSYYIAGMAGAGKSRKLAEITETYIRMTGKPVYVFCETDIRDDRAYNKIIDKVQQVVMDDDFFNEDLNINTFDMDNSLCIFDDVDAIVDKKKFQKLKDLQISILKLGRKREIDIIIVSHVFCDGMKTKVFLSECSNFIIFPSGASARSIRYGLVQYSTLDDEQVEYLLNHAGKWLLVRRTNPPYVITPNQVINIKEIPREDKKTKRDREKKGSESTMTSKDLIDAYEAGRKTRGRKK